jgi:hypothetical protein
MSTGGTRDSTAARSAALQAALDAARRRIAELQRETQEQVFEISDGRIGLIRVLETTRQKMLGQLALARRAITSTAARRRRVRRRSLWVLAGLRRRIFALRVALVMRIVLRWAVILLLAGWCLWWVWSIWGDVTEMIGSLLRGWSWP